MTATKTPIQLRLPTPVRDAIEQYAEMRDLTLTAAVRQLVGDGLEKQSQDLMNRAKDKVEARKGLLTMIENSRNREDLSWLRDQLDQDEELPALEDVPAWLKEGNQEATNIMLTAETLMDLAFRVKSAQ